MAKTTKEPEYIYTMPAQIATPATTKEKAIQKVRRRVAGGLPGNIQIDPNYKKTKQFKMPSLRTPRISPKMPRLR